VRLEIGQDWLLALDHLAIGDEGRDRPAAGGFLQLRSIIAFKRDLMGYVGEAKLGEALAHPVRGWTPFGLPEFERWS